MKKPLTLIPPAQAEALYDEALRDAWRGTVLSSAVPRQTGQPWEARDWDDDDAAQAPDGRYMAGSRAVSSAHD